MSGPIIPLTIIQADYISSLLESAVNAPIDAGQLSSALAILDPNNQQNARRVVEISSSYDGTHLYIFKLCDDGAIFQSIAGGAEVLLDDVPQGFTRNTLVFPQMGARIGVFADATVISILRPLVGVCYITSANVSFLSNGNPLAGIMHAGSLNAAALSMTNRFTSSLTAHGVIHGALMQKNRFVGTSIAHGNHSASLVQSNRMTSVSGWRAANIGALSMTNALAGTASAQGASYATLTI